MLSLALPIGVLGILKAKTVANCSTCSRSDFVYAMRRRIARAP